MNEGTPQIVGCPKILATATELPVYCDTGYCDSSEKKKYFYYTVELSDIVTIGYCDTFMWSQHCHNKRESLYRACTSLFLH